MRKIQIINGTYGYRKPGSKRIEPKTAADAPFEVEDNQASRLVALGVAAYVDDKPGKAKATPAKPPVPAASVKPPIPAAPVTPSASETPVIPPVTTGSVDIEQTGDGDGDSDNEQEEVDVSVKPEYDIETNVNILRSIAKQYGITFAVGETKISMVETLDRYFAELPDLSGGGDVVV